MVTNHSDEEDCFNWGGKSFFWQPETQKLSCYLQLFSPQFVDPTGSVGFQFLVLGFLFLMLEWVAIVGYAFFEKALRHWFSRPSMRRVFKQICAGLLGSAGIRLLLARRE